MDFNDEWTAIPMMIQPAAAFIFGLAMLLQTARWRWGLRGGFACLGVPHSWLGWLAAGLAGLAVPGRWTPSCSRRAVPSSTPSASNRSATCIA
jgi:hypothetical protein